MHNNFFFRNCLCYGNDGECFFSVINKIIVALTLLTLISFFLSERIMPALGIYPVSRRTS